MQFRRKKKIYKTLLDSHQCCVLGKATPAPLQSFCLKQRLNLTGLSLAVSWGDAELFGGVSRFVVKVCWVASSQWLEVRFGGWAAHSSLICACHNCDGWSERPMVKGGVQHFQSSPRRWGRSVAVYLYPSVLGFRWELCSHIGCSSMGQAKAVAFRLPKQTMTLQWCFFCSLNVRKWHKQVNVLLE